MHVRESGRLVGALALALAATVAAAQQAQPKAGGATSAAGAAGKADLKATLVDAEKNAARGAATVTVKVTGLELTDPASVQEVPKAGQGHLHYQLDDGPVVATTAPKLSFHGLKPGEHRVVVMLAANDHAPLGPQESLSVRVPAGAGSH